MNPQEGSKKRKTMSGTSYEVPRTGAPSASKKNISDGVKEAGSGKALVIPPSRPPRAYHNTFTVELKYVDFYTLTVGQSSYDYRVWRPFSIYDPDKTGTGHQAFSRDLWTSMYDYYTVLKADYKITVINNANDNMQYTAVGTSAQRRTHCLAGLLKTCTEGDITIQGPSPFNETKGVQSQLLLSAGSTHDHCIFSGTVTPGDWNVEAKDADSDATFTACGSNPSIERFLGLNVCALFSSATGQTEAEYASVTVLFELVQTVQFTQVNQGLRVTAS